MTATPMVGSTFFGLDISQLSTQLLSLRRRVSKRVLVLEFGPDFLLLAEATLTQNGVQLSHVTSLSLPPEALERGVPAEPLKMARLIQDFCATKKIPAHRAAVVLPPELAFQRLLDLPATLTTDEARDYVLNPANGLQIPFPLTQTDFDLFPVSTPIDQQQAGGKRLYMLTAIPEVLVDPIVEMLQAADLELQLLELGSHSQLRNHAADLITLAHQQVDLVLELLPDCSNLMLVSCSGLLGSERLASIRNLPELELEPEQLAVAVDSGLSAENLLLKDESYLPLSDLDLRVLVADLRASFERFHLKLPDAQIRRLILTGVNSSHPLLAELLSEMLGLPVVLSSSNAVTGLAGLSMDALLLQAGLGRLTGLALGLLPNDQLVACSLEGHALNNQNSQHQINAVAIADLLSSKEAQTGLDLAAVEVGASGFVSEDTKDDDPMITSDIDVDVVDPLDTNVLPGSDLSNDVDAQINHADVPLTESIEPLELSNALSADVGLDDVSSDVVLEASDVDASPVDQWPSITSSSLELQSDPDVLDAAKSSEMEWPSIQAVSTGGGGEGSFGVMTDSMEESVVDEITPDLNIMPDADVPSPEESWPSIVLEEQDLENDDVLLDDSEWPSIVDEQVAGLSGSFLVAENSEKPSPVEDELVQNLDVDEDASADSLDQVSSPVELNSSDPSAGDAPSEVSADSHEGLFISDLSLASDVDQSYEQSKDEVKPSEKPVADDGLQDLGELRFADDD